MKSQTTNTNKIEWNKKYQDKRFFLKWPDEMVVRFIAKYMNGSSTKVLDLGCGSGRHCELLAEQGYQVYGCDISAKSISLTKKRLKPFNFKGNFIESYSWNLPYALNFFDYIVAWHSIYYNNFNNMKKTVDQIYKILNTNGIALISFIAKGDFRQKYGKIVSKNTYVGKKDAFDNADLTYSIPNLNELKKILKDFSIVSIGYHEMYFNPKQRTCHWIIIVKKL